MIRGEIKTSGNINASLYGSGKICAELTLGSGGVIQEAKTVIPADYKQEVFPDVGYDGIAGVIVEPIPQDYGHISFDGSRIRVY